MASPNREIGELFDSYYEFDSHDLPCWFNEEKVTQFRGAVLCSNCSVFSCSRCSIPGDHSDHFLVNIQHKGIKLSLERQTVCAIVASPQWHGALAFAAFDIEGTLTANDVTSSAHR